ncbi:MAG: Fe-S cluster assembly ATPase SufC [bacterium]|nr:Fe-S cluster assembly ATPase SufC [bacterium]
MLKITNLHVDVEKKKILKGLNLTVETGKVHAIMGPNGSGKSTLAYALAGHPRYKITEGFVDFKGEDLLAMSVDERAKKGMFLSFQYPQEVSGVPVEQFLRISQREVARSKDEKPLTLLKFKNLVESEVKKLGMKEGMQKRNLNEGFSGGEKKRNEILQMTVLSPKLVILDEVDSGLDVDALKHVAFRVKEYAETNTDVSILIITHYMRILKFLEPDVVSIVVDGKVVKEGGKELSEYVEEKGYEGINNAK